MLNNLNADSHNFFIFALSNLKSVFMIEVRVFDSLADFSKSKPLMVQRVSVEGLKVPYESLIESFRWLYGSNCVIDFIVCQ